MDDYIKREDVLKWITIDDGGCDNYSDCEYRDTDKACSDCLYSDVNKIPAADVRENVRGHWIVRKNWLNAVCSQCSFEEKYPNHFCPNCGADMRGETNETN